MPPKAVTSKKARKSASTVELSPPDLTVPVMPLTLIACGGKILLYECITDPEQLQLRGGQDTAMRAFQNASAHAEESVSRLMDGMVAAARQHADNLEREHAAQENGAVLY